MLVGTCRQRMVTLLLRHHFCGRCCVAKDIVDRADVLIGLARRFFLCSESSHFLELELLGYRLSGSAADQGHWFTGGMVMLSHVVAERAPPASTAAAHPLRASTLRKKFVTFRS